MVQGQLSPHALQLGEGHLPEGDDEQNGDRERSCSPRGLPHPRLEFADPKAPGFRPGIPRTSLPERPDPSSLGGGPEVLGCSVGARGSCALRASPLPAPGCPLFPGCSRLLRSHGHVALPARGVPGSTPGPGDAPRSGPACGLLAASPSPSPLSLLGPRPAKQPSSGSQSLQRPPPQAPSCSVPPSLVFQPGLTPGVL